MVNFSSLNNITQFGFNNSLTNTSTDIIPNLINNTNAVSGGYYGLGVMLVVFVVLTITLYREDGGIRLDIVRSIMKSSGITFIIGLVGIVSTVFVSFVHVAWFLVIFGVFFILSYFLKKRGF